MDAADRPHLLYVTHRFPYPPNRGDRIRTFHVLKFLAARARVSVACLADEPPAPSDVEALAAFCHELAIVPIRPLGRWSRAGLSFVRGETVTEGAFRSPGLERVVREWAAGTRFEAALVSSSALAPYLQVPELRAARRYVDLIDVDSQKWLDYAAAASGPRAWLYAREGQRLRRLETQLAGWVDRLFVVSEAEADLYRGFCPEGPVTAISNGVDVDYFRPRDAATESGCVFVGALDYPPNVDAACWFSRDIWPAIRRRAPEARFRLVGREPPRAVRELAAIPGVEVVGTVPDVRPYLAEAAVVVVPLRIARGVQNKVLEAFASGKAVVCSPEPMVGLDVTSGKQLVVAHCGSEWADAVGRLLDDPAERRRLGTAGCEYVHAHHRWEVCLKPLADHLWLSGGPRYR